MADAPATLVCDNITFGYRPDEAVLRSFTAGLTAGRVCALIGPNAAGKTTLLRLLLGHLKPWQGSIRLEGAEVGGIEARRRAALMSYVPQAGSVSFGFTAEQVVNMGRYALHPAPRVVDEALAACDLAPLRDRPFATLSAGQQQRVTLARGLAQAADRGRVMLLDEPVSALDLRHAHQAMQQLRRCAGRGMAVLVVLHDLNLAARYADDVWLVEAGRMAAAGPWARVLVPEVLEPVYAVKMRTFQPPGAERPVFISELPDTLSAESQP